MNDVSPMVKRIRQNPDSPPFSSHAASAGGRFKIPKKGRIRAALALAVVAAVVKWGFLGDKDGGDGSDKNIINNNDKNIVDNRDKNIVIVDDTSSKNTAGKKFFLSCGGKSPHDSTVIGKPAAEKPPPPAPDFMMSFEDVRRLIKDHDIGAGAAERVVAVEGGKRGWGRGKDSGDDTLTVSLSIDTSLQKYAAQMLRRYKPRYGAVAMIEPATGRVLALASFANAGESMPGGALYLRSVFPAASVFKTIVAAAGVEMGRMSAKTPIQHFGGHHTLYRTQIQENLKVSREITLQDAFAYSVNPAFARIALFHTTKDFVFEMGQRFGFNEPLPFEYDVENSWMYYPDSAFSVAEFASGFNRQTSISPIFGALIAAAVCEGGAIYAPTIVDSIRSAKRDTLIYKRAPAVWRRPMRGQTAIEMRTLMTSVTRYGTARKNFRPLRDTPRYNTFEIGGKTGNVNKFGLGRVDWYVGYARDPSDKNRQVAVGVVTTHGDYWTVQSNYIASELIKKYIGNKRVF